MKNKRLPLIALVLAAALAVFYFATRECRHEWQAADCLAPQVCSLCEETKGEALGHDYVEATCHAPKTCARCSVTEGEALAHIFADADCHTPMTCTLCGDTQGEPLAHIFADATCHAPMTCTLCGDTQGEPLAHTFADATCHAPMTCTLCGDTQGEPLSHEWLPATCIAYETCALCGSTQGNLTGHTFTDTGCMTYAPCSVCGTYDGLEITHTWAEHRRVCTQCGRDERNADEHFIDAVGASLEARWSMIEADIAEVTAKENAAAEAYGRKPKTIQPVFTRERMKEFTQAEYDQIIGHRGGSFENQAFIDWAEYYIDGVIVSLDEMDSLADTVHLVEQYARDGYHMQSVALYHLNEAIPVIVADEHQDELKTMLTNGEAIAKVSDLMANISFQPVSTTPDGRDRLEAIVTNNTGLHFASFSFDVNLFDKEGGYLATKTLTADNWEPGEKRSLSFYTVKNTYQMQMMFANWMFPGGETSDAQMGGDEAAEETEEAEEAEETEEAAG